MTIDSELTKAAKEFNDACRDFIERNALLDSMERAGATAKDLKDARKAVADAVERSALASEKHQAALATMIGTKAV